MKNLVFIGGSGSTGSTLLCKILNNHNEVLCGPELSLFNKSEFILNFLNIKENISKYLKFGLRTNGYFPYYNFMTNIDYYGINEELLYKLFEKSEHYKLFVEKFVNTALLNHKKQIFIEKTPSNSYCFKWLKEKFPQSKFIHIYRNGLDVICSLKQRNYSWFQASSMWLYNTVAALEIDTNDNYYTVSYEKLVTDPEDTMNGLFEFIGVDINSQNDYGENPDYSISHDLTKKWGHTPNPQKISDSSINRYQRELTSYGSYIFYRTKLSNYSMNILNVSIKDTDKLMEYLGYDNIKMDTSHGYQLLGYFDFLKDRIEKDLKALKRLDLSLKKYTTLAR